MYQEFLAPRDEEVLDAIGQWPDTDEGGARVLRWHSDGGACLVLSYDVVGRSVRVRWTNGDELLLDIVRESATRLAFTSDPSAMHVSVDFHMGETVGALEVQVTPSFSVRDRLLFQ